MNTAQRIKYIVGLYQKICPDIKVTPDTLINNASIKKLCTSNGGGYTRIKDWCEKKVAELGKPELSPEMKKAKEQFHNCYALMQSRNKAYGNSWKVLSIQSIANLIEMKMNRISQLGEVDTKVVDEFMDCANYAIMALMKLNENKK